jgi:hypothetical protein
VQGTAYKHPAQLTKDGKQGVGRLKSGALTMVCTPLKISSPRQTRQSPMKVVQPPHSGVLMFPAQTIARSEYRDGTSSQQRLQKENSIINLSQTLHITIRCHNFSKKLENDKLFRKGEIPTWHDRTNGRQTLCHFQQAVQGLSGDTWQIEIISKNNVTHLQV